MAQTMLSKAINTYLVTNKLGVVTLVYTPLQLGVVREYFKEDFTEILHFKNEVDAVRTLFAIPKPPVMEEDSLLIVRRGGLGNINHEIVNLHREDVIVLALCYYETLYRDESIIPLDAVDIILKSPNKGLYNKHFDAMILEPHQGEDYIMI